MWARCPTATTHKLARLVYFMLPRGKTFIDQGQQRSEEQQRQLSIAALAGSQLGQRRKPQEVVLAHPDLRPRSRLILT